MFSIPEVLVSVHLSSHHIGLHPRTLGTGKSVLLREIIKTMRKKYVNAPDAVAITASTGAHIRAKF